MNYTHWIATTHLTAVSLPKLHAWFAAHQDFQSLFDSSTTELLAAGFTEVEAHKIKSINWSLIESQEKWYEKHAKILTWIDPQYPPLLKELSDPPLVLYIRGDVSLLSRPQLGIVGSRNPSPSGRSDAESFSQVLAERGLTITSGLASGIDAACHQGCLAGKGKTIAVMGTGINYIYPRSNARLAEQIAEQGALISEFPLNTRPTKWNFPQRNRIISGLSLGVLVVEAALRSGSLITARYAMEQNREVFAIPGSIHHPQARGCHRLIRQGAKLVESVDDVIEELGTLAAFLKTPVQPFRLSSPRDGLEQNEEKLLSLIEYSVTALDLVLIRSGLTAGEASSLLLSLELKGYVQVVQGGYIRSI